MLVTSFEMMSLGLVFVVLAVGCAILCRTAQSRDGGDSKMSNSSTKRCGFYMAPSVTTEEVATGIYAGASLKAQKTVEVVPTMTIHMRTVNRCQLKKYAYGSGYDEYGLIIIGPGSLYSNKQAHSIGRYLAKHEDKSPTNLAVPFMDYRSIMYVTEKRILTGQELFQKNGDHWLNRLYPGAKHVVDPKQQAPPQLTLQDLTENGHCLTGVRIGDSTVQGAGKGLFAARDFKAGEVVTISPVLTLPKRVVDDSAADSVLMNYCFASPGSELVLFPINYGPMINHASGAKTNVAVDWYDWSPAVQALSAKYHNGSGSAMQPLKLADKLAMSTHDLLAANLAQLDIAYRATRAIRQGEELFLDYGGAWQEAWEDYQTSLAEGAKEFDLAESAPVLVFREYIAAPPGLYQKHWLKQKPTHCGMFLIPSTIPGAGRAVVAGQNYIADRDVETAPTIVIDAHTADNSMLDNYVFSTPHPDFKRIIFGPGNIYNHAKHQTMRWFKKEEKDPSFAPFPYTDAIDAWYKSVANIETGEEMYEYYGDGWFMKFQGKGGKKGTREVAEARVAAQRMDAADLLQHGVCLTDTSVRASTVPGAGRGLFASRDFAAGEVVTVSPVLTLPKTLVDASAELTVLMNYCFSAPDSELVLFPINYGPMINHAPGVKANVAVDWYDWSPAVQALSAKYHRSEDGNSAMQPLKLADKLAMSAQDLFTADFAQLDIAYRATRAIRQGEELFLDYSGAWQEAWDAYAVRIAAWVEAQRVLGVEEQEALASRDAEKPVFRQYMAAPEGLYQAHWKVASSAASDRTEL